jgi:hypothetical protein
MKELNEISDVDIYENWVEPEPDPDAEKYRVHEFEDFLTPRNIVNPRHLVLYEPENERHFTEENAALDTLLQKDPSKLIHPEKERITILLRARGLTINEICSRVEWTKPTVIKTIRRFAAEISKLKRTEIEEVVQLYAFTLRKRIATFGKIQGVLMAELETRNAQDIPTDKIIDLLIKCDKAVSDDILQKIAAGADSDGKMGKVSLY